MQCTFDGVRVEDVVKYSFSAVGIAGVTRITVDAQNASTTKVYELLCTQQIHRVKVEKVSFFVGYPYFEPRARSPALNSGDNFGYVVLNRDSSAPM